MAYQLKDKLFGQGAKEVELVPMAFVHVPCSLYVAIFVAQGYGAVGIAFQDKPCGVFEVDHGKDFSFDFKGEGCFVEREVFFGVG